MIRLFPWAATAAVAGTALLSGCTHYEPVSLHGAASMRVEMEVYKGPATLSPAAQIGQTAAVLADLVHALHDWNVEAKAYFSDPVGPTPRWIRVDGKCRPYTAASATESTRLEDVRDCDELAAAVLSSERAVAQVCLLTESPTFEQLGNSVSLPKTTCNEAAYKNRWEPVLAARTADSEADRLTGQFNGPDACVRQIAEDRDGGRAGLATLGDLEPILNRFTCQHERIVLAMEAFSTQLRASALRAADATVRHVPGDRRFRGLIATYAYIASEYGGQISARVNVLNKQLVYGRDVRSLPMGDYLRGAKSTDFVHIIEWLDAADRHDGVAFAGIPDLPARVRMAERLNSDAYWEKFNEVYASGQGDVAMAFVKNELGNWDLKSFSNDPSKLLASYRKTTDALLSTAVRLASKAASGPAGVAASQLSASQKALDLANRLAGGETGGTSALDTAAMHSRVVARIRARQAAMTSRVIALQQEQLQLQQRVAHLEPQAAGGVAAAQVELAASTQRLASVSRQIEAAPGEALNAIRDILEDHSLVLAAAQEAIAAPAPEKASSTPAR